MLSVIRSTALPYIAHQVDTASSMSSAVHLQLYIHTGCSCVGRALELLT